MFNTEQAWWFVMWDLEVFGVAISRVGMEAPLRTVRGKTLGREPAHPDLACRFAETTCFCVHIQRPSFLSGTSRSGGSPWLVAVVVLCKILGLGKNLWRCFISHGKQHRGTAISTSEPFSWEFLSPVSYEDLSYTTLWQHKADTTHEISWF